MQVANCTTAAQYFHLLRRQARQKQSKPLVVITPKSLLRLPEAASSIEEFTSGGFLPVIGDREVQDPAAVARALFCSGKVFYDLSAERKKLDDVSTAIVRVEQLYPFPKKLIAEELKQFVNATDICWVQEEPKNMGAWFFIEPRLSGVLGSNQGLRYAGRPASASPATGSHTIHQMEQRRLIKNAFSSE
jgi:2-oxoglutarate dehydrogenase E1 component